MMQLDDVISSTNTDDARFEEALYRSIRWYDRCRKEHERSQRDKVQNLFPIIQGGLNANFRRISVREIVSRNPPGIAIGGLSGGEEKLQFIEMVAVSTEDLPPHLPRYLMGVGYAVDMMLSVALGCDMFDCVFPTRTARFGSALIELGKQISLQNKKFLTDNGPVCPDCNCTTCQTTTRSYLCNLFRTKNPVACQLLTVHNLRFQMRFMELIREAIIEQKFESFILKVLIYHYGPNGLEYPDWIKRALELINITLP